MSNGARNRFGFPAFSKAAALATVACGRNIVIDLVCQKPPGFHPVLDGIDC